MGSHLFGIGILIRALCTPNPTLWRHPSEHMVEPGVPYHRSCLAPESAAQTSVRRPADWHDACSAVVVIPVASTVKSSELKDYLGKFAIGCRSRNINSKTSRCKLLKTYIRFRAQKDLSKRKRPPRKDLC